MIGVAASRSAAASIRAPIDGCWLTSPSVIRVGGSIGRLAPIGRAQPGDRVGLAADVAGQLPLGQPGQEEVRVVAARLELRRDPARPWGEQVAADHQIPLRGSTRRSPAPARPARLAAPPNRRRTRHRPRWLPWYRRAAHRTPRTPPVPRRRPPPSRSPRGWPEPSRPLRRRGAGPGADRHRCRGGRRCRPERRTCRARTASSVPAGSRIPRNPPVTGRAQQQHGRGQLRVPPAMRSPAA